MNPVAALPARTQVRASFRWLLIACALTWFVAIISTPTPAQAVENKTYGDVTVPVGANFDEVHTGMGNVVVHGAVKGDVKTGSGNVKVFGPVGGNVKAGQGNVRIEAPVEGDVKSGFGDVYINATVKGDVDVGRGDVRFGEEARIQGDLRCSSGRIQNGAGAVVAGETLSGMSRDFDDNPGPGASQVVRFVAWVLGTLALVGITVLAAILMPHKLESVTRQAEAAPWISLTFGVLSMPVVVMLMVILAVSIVGSPLILLFIPAYVALAIFGLVVISFLAGRRLLFATGRYHGGNALAAIVGSLVVAAIYGIPYVGQIIFISLALLGLGATILTLFNHRRSRNPAPSYEAYVQERSEA
jgi:hypothetical protein